MQQKFLKMSVAKQKYGILSREKKNTLFEAKIFRKKLWSEVEKKDSQPVNHLPPPLLLDHVQEGHPEVVADAAIPHHFVPEDHQAQVVHVLTVVLLHIHPVHVHQDVPDHHHGGLVVVPSCIEGLEEVVVERLQHVLPDLGLQVVGHHLLQAAVQALAVFVQHHGVGVPVQLLEAQPRVVLPLNLLRILGVTDICPGLGSNNLPEWPP